MGAGLCEVSGECHNTNIKITLVGPALAAVIIAIAQLVYAVNKMPYPGPNKLGEPPAEGFKRHNPVIWKVDIALSAIGILSIIALSAAYVWVIRSKRKVKKGYMIAVLTFMVLLTLALVIFNIVAAVHVSGNDIVIHVLNIVISLILFAVVVVESRTLLEGRSFVPQNRDESREDDEKL
ncbi:unnamed protein product [Notodromas monacha]|uniref:Uncharacterized protein n=1 Tax=Notodromas monacha TaxID=399045 RepID=A0A7R9BSS5_9CRUS|nr:unnamed protein product [Notodromas monacha]CAG0921067.1 unnamed protein product [Notodromas monacha]